MNKIYEYLTKIWIYEYKIQCKMKNMNNKSDAKCTKKVWIVVWIGLNVSLNIYESRFIFIHIELLSGSSLYDDSVYWLPSLCISISLFLG